MNSEIKAKIGKGISAIGGTAAIMSFTWAAMRAVGEHPEIKATEKYKKSQSTLIKVGVAGIVLFILGFFFQDYD